MPLPIAVQINIVFYGLLSGILTGLIFDLYRITRGAKVPKVIVVIQDILFWILAALVVFYFLLYTNYALLGLYVYVFMIIALLLYLKFISPIFEKIEMTTLEISGKIIRCLFKNIIYSFKIVVYSLTGKK